MMQNKFNGRLILLTNPEGRLIDDIDTDQIFHNQYLHITEINEMGAYALGNLEGWVDFPKMIVAGDVVVAGANFGSGSSRQHAVDCFRALGVQLIIAESFGAIYKRNAINSGMPIIAFPEAGRLVEDGQWKHLQAMEMDLESGKLVDMDSSKEIVLPSLSKVQRDIMAEGSLLKL